MCGYNSLLSFLDDNVSCLKISNLVLKIYAEKLIALQTFDFTGLYLLPKNDVNLTQSVRTKKQKM